MNDGGFSIRACQRKVLCEMLALPATLRPCAWKLAVFDARGGEILALCLRAGDVARCGVTLAQRLEDATRARVPGVPCVYLVAPTPETLDRVARDLAPGGLYTAAVVCARSGADAAAAAALAEALHRHAAARAFRAFTALHTDFLSLSDTLFVTGEDDDDGENGENDDEVHNSPDGTSNKDKKNKNKNTYFALRDPTLDERGATALVEQIASRLYDVVATLGVVPVIRAQAGTAAADVAQRLHARLREHPPAGSGAGAGFRRPLLALFDRDYDLGAALAHAWSYGGLVRQLFAGRLNRAAVPADGAAGTHEHYLDADADPLWRRLAPLPFPGASDALHQEVRAYRADAEHVRARTSGDGADEDDSSNGGSSSSVAAAQMAERAAELRERKAHIDAHVETVAAVLRAVEQRRLFDLHELERALLRTTGTAPPSAELTRAVLAAVVPQPSSSSSSEPNSSTSNNTDSSGSTVEDRLRLYLVWLLANSAESLAGTNAGHASTMEAALAREDAKTAAAVAHVRRTKAFLDQAAAAASSSSSPSPVSPGASPSAPARRTLFRGVVDTLARASSAAAASGTGGAARAVRAFAAMMGGREWADERAFVCLDPRQPDGRAPARRAAFRDGIFFVVGGGSYAEHEDLLQTLCAPDTSGAAPVRVLYGATEMLRPESFLKTFAALH